MQYLLDAYSSMSAYMYDIMCLFSVGAYNTVLVLYGCLLPWLHFSLLSGSTKGTSLVVCDPVQAEGYDE